MLNSNNLIWLDLEMTGLDPDYNRIIEIATVVTDANLNILAEGPVIAIYQPDVVLDSMDEWNTNQHTKSGLVRRVRDSHLSEEDAQAETIEFLMQYVPQGESPMCGNSICQDRRFIYRWMPKLAKYFHYRNLDVSSIKILARLWMSSDLLASFTKEPTHLALQDIYDSITELKFYKEYFFRF
jgi:oligoribonuclease